MNTILIKERPELKTSELLNLCRDKFKVSCYLSDEEMDRQFPTPKEATERYFLNSVEPDKKTLGLSANQADPDKKGITLRERIIMELEYFEKTGKHLDIDNYTLCSGSRDADGYVPNATWYWGFGYGFEVGGCNPGYSGSGDGIRSEVSLDSSSYIPHTCKAKKYCENCGELLDNK